MKSALDFHQLKFDALQKFWQYPSFRDLQEEVINSISSGRDTLVLLPTGSGKSLCYQLPALILEGICLVISPLVALMRDQVYQLQNKGIDAAYLSAEMDDTDIENIFQNCRNGLIKILYISPERLTNPYFIKNIEDINLSFIAIDEAHCISEWGQDFRPSYQNIKNFRNDVKKVPCIALTATATPKVLEEINAKLQLITPSIFKKSFLRDNIHINTLEISDKYSYIAHFLRNHNGAGIIYTRTRKEAEELQSFLEKSNITTSAYYHAGLTAKEKKWRQEIWMTGTKPVLIATNAFGMGIDKSDVRFVIHLSPPASVENYYQEIGRCGRDGNQSLAILLYNPQELANIGNILINQIPDEKEFIKVTQYLYSIYQIAESEKNETIFSINLNRVKSATQISIPKISAILNFLQHQEILYYNPNPGFSSLILRINPEDLSLLSARDAYLIELLLRNLPGIFQQKIYFKEENLAAKLGTEKSFLKQSLLDLDANNTIQYVDGNQAQIKFIHPRNDTLLKKKWWPIFRQIQQNKWQKWEEIKFYLTENKYCKMKMILSYFGEKTSVSCNKCSVCLAKNTVLSQQSILEDIIQSLQKKPATLEEIFVRLSLHKKEKLRENLIFLLDSGKVKMLDFRTYIVV